MFDVFGWFVLCERVRNGSANNAGNQIVYERLYVQNSPKRLYVSTKAKRQLPAFQRK